MTSPPDLLRIENLHINFRVHSTLVEAVRGASFRIRPGKVTALVGESGSGKSVIGQSIMGILPKVGAISGGSITFNDPEATGGPIQIEQLLPSGARDAGVAWRAHRHDLPGADDVAVAAATRSATRSRKRSGAASEGRTSQTHGLQDVEEMLGLVGFPNPKPAFDMYPSNCREDCGNGR
jgi:peptide/nickel transport system ATP-binding protein